MSRWGKAREATTLLVSGEMVYIYQTKGATGFDGSSDDHVACPGSQSPGKTTGAKQQLPTLTWLWLRKVILAHLLKRQPA